MSVTTIDVDTKKELLKRTICKGASDDELEMFAALCRQTGLNPFVRQIFMIPRKERTESGQYITKMTTMTSIDGLRLIAERTKNYAPGREPSYQYDEQKRLISATSYIKKRTEDGVWHDISSTAYYSEYVQRGKEGKPMSFWERMPHVMLAKCAEALALRRAFPAEMSGVYTEDEMSQAMNPPAVEIVETKKEVVSDKLTDAQELELESHLIYIKDKSKILKLEEFLKIPSLYEMKREDFQRSINYLKKCLKEQHDQEFEGEFHAI